MPNPRMTPAERETFLAGTHVGVFSVAEPDRGPCTVPVWYRYSPGQAVHITMGGASRKAVLLRAAKRASLCAQSETLPYKYVSVEGPVEIVTTDPGPDQREMALRYLGARLGERYLAAIADDLRTEVLVLLRPERWWSVDFARMTLG